MLKALLKKQFMEFFAGIFIDRKTGKARSKGGIIGFALLFGFLFLYLAAMFFGIGLTLSPLLNTQGYEWLYFAIFCMIAVGFGIIGSAFTTYSALYKAKDNEFLLSLPIKSSTILFVRMFSIFTMSALYSGCVWIPGIIVYIISDTACALGIIYSILLWIILSIFITVVASLLGFLIAIIAGKVKKKSLITVIITIIFFGLYYIVCFKMSDAMTSFAENPETTGAVILRWVYPMYIVGKASLGSTLPFFIITSITAVLFALLYLILAKSFIKIVTTNKGNKKTEYKGNSVKTRSIRRALLHREIKRFLGSSAYLLNCGFGVIFLLGISILVIVRTIINGFTIAKTIENLSGDMAYIKAFVPAIIIGIAMLITSMDCYTAPSISLEGENLWIIRTLPVKSIEILKSKVAMQILINLIPAIILVITFGVVTMQNVGIIILSVICCSLFVVYIAILGLKIGIKKANLHWTNESIPLKQGSAIVLTLFGSWGVSIATIGVCILLSLIIPVWAYLTTFILVYIGLIMLGCNWLKNKGVKIFESL